MHGIRAVIFDNDGTLVDTHDMILASFQHAMEEVLGREFPEETLMAKVGIPLVDQMRDYSDDPEVVDELVRTYRADNEAHHDERIRGFPDARPALEKIHGSGLVMAVATSKRHHLAWRGLEVLGISGYFETLVGCDETEGHKPAPDPLLEAARRIGVDPVECAYVGDAVYDVQAAKAAGCVSVAVAWGMGKMPDIEAEEPDYIVSTFGQLADLLISLKA